MKKVISGEVRAQLCGDIFCAIFEYYFTKGTFNKPNPVPLRKKHLHCLSKQKVTDFNQNFRRQFFKFSISRNITSDLSFLT